MFPYVRMINNNHQNHVKHQNKTNVSANCIYTWKWKSQQLKIKLKPDKFPSSVFRVGIMELFAVAYELTPDYRPGSRKTSSAAN